MTLSTWSIPSIPRGVLAEADDDEIDDLLVMVKGKGKVGGASRKRKREVQMPSANIGLGSSMG